jgi:hypothetical protein
VSTPNPALQAAAPVLITVLQELEAMVSTITTGDPLLIAARVQPAVQIFLAQVELQLPALAGAGQTLLSTEVNTKIGTWITSLKALSTAT